MEIIEKNIDELIPYEHNPRKNDDAVEAVANSIREFGFKVPVVVDKDNVVVAGHTRIKAARELGIDQIPCIVADDLTDEQIKAYRLADNKVAEFADWNFEKLDEELFNIEIDMSQFGFEIATDDFESAEIEEVDTPTDAETRCKRGDLWQLGNHRLICGDATDANCIEILMGGARSDIVITSPPYNADKMEIPIPGDRGGGVQKGTQKKYLADNDNMTDDEYFDFLKRNIEIMMDNADEVFYNVGVGAGSKRVIADILHEFRDSFKDLLYWEKLNPVPCIVESVISSSVELIIAFGKNSTRSFNHFNDRLFHGVIQGQSASATNQYADIHKATFPVYMPAEIIQRFTPDNGTVLDCFGGTGTTMIACEQLGRTCYMSELDERYCDVIIKRWEEYTGKTAVKI